MEIFNLPESASPGIYGGMILNTGSFNVRLAQKAAQKDHGDIWSSALWDNDTEKDIIICKTKVWCGAEKGFVGDIHFEAFRVSDETEIGKLQWDHYTEPTLPHHYVETDFPSPYVILKPNDGIEFRFFGNLSDPGAFVVNIHFTFSMWCVPGDKNKNEGGGKGLFSNLQNTMNQVNEIYTGLMG